MRSLNFKKFLFKTLKQGVHGSNPEITSFIVQTNLNGLIFFCLDMALAAILFPVFDDPYISYGMLVAGFLYLSTSVGFNYLGWTTASRLSTVTIGSFLTVYCSLYLGPGSFAPASLLLGAILPFVYFNLQEKKLLAFSISLPLACFAFLLTVDYQFGPQFSEFNPSKLTILQIVFFLIPFIGIMTNTISAVVQRERKAQQLAESQRLLSAVFNALFHDLANPAMMVFMISDAAQETQSMNTKTIDRLHRVTDQMKRVISKLKKMTMISGGKNQLQYEKFKLNDLVIEAMGFSLAQATAKGVELSIEESTEDLWINVDRDIFIFQILTNLISNAIKFTEKGKRVTLSIKSKGPVVNIEIRDQGVGIEEERIPHLLSWKNQTSTRGTDGERGSGLGLPLAQKFLEFMNGKISIQSFTLKDFPQSHGTTVILEISLTNAEEKKFNVKNRSQAEAA